MRNHDDVFSKYTIRSKQGDETDLLKTGSESNVSRNNLRHEIGRRSIQVEDMSGTLTTECLAIQWIAYPGDGIGIQMQTQKSV